MSLLHRLRGVVDPLAKYRRSRRTVDISAPGAEAAAWLEAREAQVDRQIVARGNRRERRALAKVLR